MAVVSIPTLTQPGRLLGGRRDGGFLLEAKEQAYLQSQTPQPPILQAQEALNKY